MRLFKIKGIKLIIIGVLPMILSSCVTLPRPSTASLPSYIPSPQAFRQNIIHTVGPGETIWRIGKIYDVPIDDIRRANKLSGDNLIMGQELVIPGAMPACSVVPLYPSGKWKYIIIHHSASDVGDALLFHKSHTNYRGFSRGLGYHFVIDNGTYGKPNGYIEVSPRWLKQHDGAHCKAGGMNHKSIGVCLVGNFSKDNLSDKQLSSLVYLVDILKRYYHIPRKNIMGHGQVPGAQTECPGTKFPWSKFFEQLNRLGN
jgi:N-acetylmuramoyl-L-alanine amidase